MPAGAGSDDEPVALGGMDRGSFAPYGRYHDPAAVLNALRHVFLTPVEQAQLDVARLSDQAQTLAVRLKAQPAESLTPRDVPVGTALDQIGPDSGFCLFLLDTPFGERPRRPPIWSSRAAATCCARTCRTRPGWRPSSRGSGSPGAASW